MMRENQIAVLHRFIPNQSETTPPPPPKNGNIQTEASVWLRIGWKRRGAGKTADDATRVSNQSCAPMNADET